MDSEDTQSNIESIQQADTFIVDRRAYMNVRNGDCHKIYYQSWRLLPIIRRSNVITKSKRHI